jgi:hypothetical protein
VVNGRGVVSSRRLAIFFWGEHAAWRHMKVHHRRRKCRHLSSCSFPILAIGTTSASVLSPSARRLARRRTNGLGPLVRPIAITGEETRKLTGCVSGAGPIRATGNGDAREPPLRYKSSPVPNRL